MKTIDINCDLGEGLGANQLGRDAEIMPYITSANIACGFHAGDPGVMVQTVRLAKASGVKVGAHPGYPDREGFGRRDMTMLPAEVEAMLIYQIGALAGICRAEGVDLVHVKPHGALYNKAASDPDLAVTLAKSVREFSRELILVGLAGSYLITAGKELGLNVLSEGFADRVYEPDGSLRSRSLPGAMITDPNEVARHGAELAEKGVIARMGEHIVHWDIDTICIHGDEPNAVENAIALRTALSKND